MKMIIIKKIGNMQSNCYIIACEATNKGVIIDPGSNPQKIIEHLNLEQLTIEYIFNTHHHADHTGANRALLKKTRAKLLMHKAEVPFLRKIIRGDKIFACNFSLSPQPDIVIEKECTIKTGNLTFQIIHTPGHTPGGLCFYCEDKLFTGDTLFVGDSGATIFPGGDRATLGKSLRKLMTELPGNTIIYPGHDYGPIPTSTLDWEKRNNVNAKEYGYYIED